MCHPLKYAQWELARLSVEAQRAAEARYRKAQDERPGADRGDLPASPDTSTGQPQSAGGQSEDKPCST